MGLLVGPSQVIDAAVAFGLVVAFQAAYCGLKVCGTLHVENKTRLWALIGLGCFLGFMGLAFMTLFLAFRARADFEAAAYVTMILWKGASVTSIWGFEILEFPPTDAKSLSIFGKPLFWAGLAVQFVFAAVGVWQLVVWRLEILWAFPIVPHMFLVAKTAPFSVPDQNKGRLRIWLVVSISATAVSAAMLVGSALRLVPAQVTAQCGACVAILTVKAVRDGLWVASQQGISGLERGFELSTSTTTSRQANSGELFLSHTSDDSLPPSRTASSKEWHYV